MFASLANCAVAALFLIRDTEPQVSFVILRVELEHPLPRSDGLAELLLRRAAHMPVLGSRVRLEHRREFPCRVHVVPSERRHGSELFERRHREIRRFECQPARHAFHDRRSVRRA